MLTTAPFLPFSITCLLNWTVGDRWLSPSCYQGPGSDSNNPRNTVSVEAPGSYLREGDWVLLTSKDSVCHPSRYAPQLVVCNPSRYPSQCAVCKKVMSDSGSSLLLTDARGALLGRPGLSHQPPRARITWKVSFHQRKYWPQNLLPPASSPPVGESESLDLSVKPPQSCHGLRSIFSETPPCCLSLVLGPELSPEL